MAASAALVKCFKNRNYDNILMTYSSFVKIIKESHILNDTLKETIEFQIWEKTEFVIP